MADFFPFDNGPGANVSESQWGLMAKNWLGTGVIKGALNEHQVYADSTGMQCKVKSGNAWIQGFFFQTTTETIIPISAANATNPRIDRIAIQVDWTNNNISLIAIQGTPASSPVPPALTQNTSIWQISLAQVYVGANVSTIAAGNITDERVFTQNAINQRISIGAGLFFTNGSSMTATANITWDKAFSKPPHVIPCDITQLVSYGDIIYYPYIFNVTTTGCSVRIQSTNVLGTSTPTNLIMWFMAIGQ